MISGNPHKRAVSECAGFELYTERIGFFGSPRNPRVIWLGLKKSIELQRLAVALENSLDKAGFGRSDKTIPGAPHPGADKKTVEFRGRLALAPAVSLSRSLVGDRD